MMKKVNIQLIFAMLLFCFASCQKDPLDGIQNHDRQFLSFTVERQVGPALIKPKGKEKGTIEVFALADNLDLSNITPSFTVSEKARVNPPSGQPVNFDNDRKSFTYEVTSESGKVREWTVFIKSYDSPIEGSWQTTNIEYDWHVGLFEDWGWGVFGAYDVASGTYDPDNYAPEKLRIDFPETGVEIDNVLELTTELINGNGNPEGTFEFGAGADNQFATFILDPDHTGNRRDYSERYRKLPIGRGVWEYNEGGKVLTFWEGNRNGKESAAKVTIDQDGNMMLAFDIWADDYTWDHFNAESHIQNGRTLYYLFDKF